MTVNDVAFDLNVCSEEVRRWIRSGKLKASMTSRKKGYYISEEDYAKFLLEYRNCNRWRIVWISLNELLRKIGPTEFRAEMDGILEIMGTQNFEPRDVQRFEEPQE